MTFVLHNAILYLENKQGAKMKKIRTIKQLLKALTENNIQFELIEKEARNSYSVPKPFKTGYSENDRVSRVAYGIVPILITKKFRFRLKHFDDSRLRNTDLNRILEKLINEGA